MIKSKEITLAIDASRNRSGGAVAHLLGILSAGNPAVYGIGKIHLWSYQALLGAIPDQPWLIKHNPPALEDSLLKQIWWQRFRFPYEFKKVGCNIILNTDAGTVSTISPSVTMSRDMLSYEPGAIELYGFSLARLRLLALRYMQNRSLRRADGAVFLTHYAARVIQHSCGRVQSIAYIPHGVGDAFTRVKKTNTWPLPDTRPIRCLYVSNAELYKNQWVVIKAVALLRKRGIDLTLTLIGGGKGRAQELLQDAIDSEDPSRSFVEQLEFLPQNELPDHIAHADLFIFASSCENMPNTLVEAMAVGLPIACSNRGPMPEVLGDGGVYFDPTDTESIAEAIKKIVETPALRLELAQHAKTLSQQYSWKRCAEETWNFVVETHLKVAQV